MKKKTNLDDKITLHRRQKSPKRGKKVKNTQNTLQDTTSSLLKKTQDPLKKEPRIPRDPDNY